MSQVCQLQNFKMTYASFKEICENFECLQKSEKEVYFTIKILPITSILFFSEKYQIFLIA